jgi:hypothetical protein
MERSQLIAWNTFGDRYAMLSEPQVQILAGFLTGRLWKAHADASGSNPVKTMGGDSI